MRGLITTRRHVLTGWWVCPLALLTLPNCGLLVGLGSYNSPVADAGPAPRADVVFCEIQQPPGQHCATDTDILLGIRFADAAIALVSGQKGAVALDDSPLALQNCGGRPVAFPFQGNFPDGYAACLNCSQIGTTYADAKGVLHRDLRGPLQSRRHR